MKVNYNSEIINAIRIVSHGKIDNLASVFHLPKNEGFTLFAVPKEGVEAGGIRLNVRLVMDSVYSEVPIRMNEWQPIVIDSIGGNQNSILESVDLYWGSGYFIQRAEGKVTDAPKAKNLKYTGEAQQLLVAGSGTGTMMYKMNGGWTPVIPTATNVGVYDVQYKCIANNIYTESAIGTLRCAIAEKFINDPTINLTPESFVYSGNACVPTVEVLDGQRVIPAEEYTVQISNNVNAGTANVVILDNIGGNYEVLGTTTFEIAKATPTVVAPTAKVLTFNGSAQELVNAGSTDFGTLQYSLDGENWSTTIPSATNTGSYTVKYRVVGDSNVNDVAAVNVQCSINEKQVTATVELSQSVYTYDGTAKQPTVVVKDGTTVIDPSEYTVSYSNNVNAGTGTVTITDKSAGNYEVIGSATFTINKADITPSVSISGWTYGGTPSTPSVSGNPGGGSVAYTYSADGSSYSSTVPTNAGSYYIKATIGATQNYNGGEATAQFTIAKANRTLSFTTAPSSVEVGSSITVAAAASAGDGTITYSSSNTSIATVSGTSVTGVAEGTCNISASIPATQNYNAATTSYQLTVAAVQPTPTPTDDYVDLGLPSGLLWAKGNIVADGNSYKVGNETDYGAYVSWGNVTPHFSSNGSTFDDSYDFGTSNSGPYAQTAGASIQFTSQTKQADFSPTSGNDAARELLGGDWRVPTATEFKELYDNTDGELTSINGVNGYKFMKKSDHSVYVFFPAGGYGEGSSLNNKSYGGYWSSSLYSADVGYGLGFNSYGVYPQNSFSRHRGYLVRAVKDPTPAPSVNFIDLGLPSGTKWADRNLGADSEEAAGLYFAWGETTGYVDAAARNTALGLTGGFDAAAYQATGASAISSNLTLAQDAANVMLGGSCRMPTEAEFDELISGCNVTWTTKNGVSGRLFTSKTNGNSIFIPAVGFYDGTTLSNSGIQGRYWSSTYGESSSAYRLRLSASTVYLDTQNRYNGISIRPIQPVQ